MRKRLAFGKEQASYDNLNTVVIPQNVDPHDWFKVLIHVDWQPGDDEHDLMVFFEARVKEAAPDFVSIQILQAEVETEARPMPVRGAVISRTEAKSGNCQIHDQNYTRQTPPGKGKATVTIDFAGGTLTWTQDFNFPPS